MEKALGVGDWVGQEECRCRHQCPGRPAVGAGMSDPAHKLHPEAHPSRARRKHGRSEEEAPVIVQEADAVYESVRTICHHSETQPAPTVYRVLGNRKGAAGPMLAQALNQLADGLERSLTEYDVYEDDGSDPALNVAAAAGHMRVAAHLAAEIGEQLAEAQNAIAQQGYRATAD